MYGTGVPDWATLPSYLSRDLNAVGDCAVVSNFGVEGYVTQSRVDCSHGAASKAAADPIS